MGNHYWRNAIVRQSTLMVVLLLAVCGCRSTPANKSGEKPSQAIEIEVVKAQEHLGHNITEGLVHTVWCDGCRARVAGSNDSFVIYWVNNEIKNTPFRFSEGGKYTIWFTGELETGVMAYRGKCIDIGQIVRVEEK